MSTRVFAYARVSTVEQTTENQLREIRAAGFSLEPRRIITESVSGSVAAGERSGFAKLLEKLEAGDVLVVTKMDRLGRNAMDVRATVEKLAGMGVRTHCLQLGGADLTSPAGKMTMGVLGCCAEFERDLLIERTHAGLERARAEGIHLGRSFSFDVEQRQTIQHRCKQGENVSGLAREFKTTRQTIMRIRAESFEATSVKGVRK